MTGYGGTHQGIDLVPLSYVNRLEKRIASGVPDEIERGVSTLERRRGNVRQNDLSAFAGEGQRYRAPDSRAGAGDDGDLSGK